jgi:hypothetical protein
MTRIIEARPRSTPSKLDESKMLINVQYFSVLSDVVTGTHPTSMPRPLLDI